MALNFSSFSLLLENREEFLKQKYGKEIIDLYQKKWPHDATWRTIPEKSLDTIFGFMRDSVDPTRNKVYLQWIVGQHIKYLKDYPGMHRWAEDVLAVRNDLAEFDRVKSRMPGDQRDINRYKTYYDLRAAIEPYLETKSGKEIKREEIARYKRDIRVVYEGSDVNIYIPKTQESSCFLGRGTKWCTAATGSDNFFNNYNKIGDLIVFIFPNGEKYQLHNESGQFMNEQDYSVDIKQWMEKYGFAIKRLIASGVVSQEDMYNAVIKERSFMYMYTHFMNIKMLVSYALLNFPYNLVNLEAVGVNTSEIMKNIPQDKIIDHIVDDSTWASNENKSLKIKKYAQYLDKSHIAKLFGWPELWFPLYKHGYVVPRDIIDRYAQSTNIYPLIAEIYREAQNDDFINYILTSLPKSILHYLIKEYPKMMDICKDVGYPIEVELIDKIKSEFENSVQDIKFEVKEVRLDDPNRTMLFGSWTARAAQAVFTDGVYSVSMALDTRRNIIKSTDVMSVKHLDKYFGEGYKKSVRDLIVKRLNNAVKHLSSKQRCLILLTEDMWVRDILRFLDFRVTEAGFVGDNLADAYHLVNNSFSGRAGAELLEKYHIDMSSVASLIKIIIEQMTLG